MRSLCLANKKLADQFGWLWRCTYDSTHCRLARRKPFLTALSDLQIEAGKTVKVHEILHYSSIWKKRSSLNVWMWQALVNQQWSCRHTHTNIYIVSLHLICRNEIHPFTTYQNLYITIHCLITAEQFRLVEQWVHWRNANADGRDANGEKMLKHGSWKDFNMILSQIQLRQLCIMFANMYAINTVGQLCTFSLDCFHKPEETPRWITYRTQLNE